MLYRNLLRPLMFRLPPETAHELALRAPAWAIRLAAGPSVASPGAVTRFGLKFPNPIGLAAGFDKDARWFTALAKLGFGSIEVGSVTAEAQPGNPTPRLFRLSRDSALLNRMGFNNRGSEAMALRLAATDLAAFKSQSVLGINLGKTKIVPLDRAADDYCLSFQRLFDFGDYFVINVSSPNTPGLRSLQDRGPLTEILSRIGGLNRQVASDKQIAPRPVFLKIAPDLENEHLSAIVDLALETSVAGLIATNTTISRSGLRASEDRLRAIGDGGLSGKPLFQRTCQVVSHLFRRLAGRLPIIGVGGVFSGEDAWQLIGDGASLVQLYTGFIYGGPGIVKSINRCLISKIAAANLPNLSAAVGRNHS